MADKAPTELELAVQKQFGLEPGLDRAALIPYKSKEKGWIAPEAIYDLAKLVASPITVLHGKYVSPEETISSGTTIAGFMTPVGLVSKAEPTVARIFIGPNAESWNPKTHALALKMEDEGASPREIWRQTMNWRTPQGKWTQEISDLAAKYDQPTAVKKAKEKYKADVAAHEEKRQAAEDALKVNAIFKELKDTVPNPVHLRDPDTGAVIYNPNTGQPMIKDIPDAYDLDYAFHQGLKEKAKDLFQERHGYLLSPKAEDLFRNEFPWRNKTISEQTPRDVGLVRPSDTTIRGLPIGSALEHPDLYSAYPVLAKYPFDLKTQALMGGADASYRPSKRLISLSTTSENPRGSLLHEMQHAVQHGEGWEMGASPDDFKDVSSRVAHNLYLRNLGEGMARATEARKDLSMAERRDLFPEDSFSLRNVSPGAAMDQFMWKGMDPYKSRDIIEYVRGNMFTPGTWKDFKYDPDKVSAIADALESDIDKDKAGYAKGGDVDTDDKMSLSDKLENLSIGLGKGFENQLEGMYQLAAHPIESGKAVVKGVKAVITDPSIIKDALSGIVAKATESPMGLGEVIGENVNPISVPKRLAAIGKPVVKELTVYHGTPHRFPATERNPLGEFDASKIGTGEGAQAYGHGIYVAQAPEVAEEYKKRLSDETFTIGKGEVFAPAELEHLNIRTIMRSGDLDAAINKAKEIIKKGQPGLPDRLQNSAIQMAKNDLSKLQEIKKSGGLSAHQGNLYTVNLPDEHIERMLDWDAPLSEQSESVRQYFGDVDPNNRISTGLAYSRMKDATGKSAPQISKDLRAMGIPGIRYLDEGSRGKSYQVALSVKGKPYETDPITFATKEQAAEAAKEYADKGFTAEVKETGTRNFVIFPGEEHNLNILERKAEGGLVAQQSNMEYDPQRAQAIADNLWREIYNE